MAHDEESDARDATARRHMSFGWWSLLVFLSLGVLLEVMHGFKIGWYLDVSNETRRLMWTLAHTHGTLFSLVNIVFALTLMQRPDADAGLKRIASPCLLGATVLMPGGFFLGGLVTYGGDPGLGNMIAPLGALLLFVAVFAIARSLRAKR